MPRFRFNYFFFFNDTATTEIYTLSLHDALPIWLVTEAAAQFGVGALPLGTIALAEAQEEGALAPIERVVGLAAEIERQRRGMDADVRLAVERQIEQSLAQHRR